MRPTKPAVSGLDRPRIRDRRRCAIAGEPQIAGIEVGVGEAERRGDESAADIDRAGGRDRDAVGIDEEDLTVGVDLARERRRRRTVDPVQDRRGRIGLDESDDIAGADRKCLPIQNRPLRGLSDRERAGPRRADRRGSLMRRFRRRAISTWADARASTPIAPPPHGALSPGPTHRCGAFSRMNSGRLFGTTYAGIYKFYVNLIFSYVRIVLVVNIYLMFSINTTDEAGRLRSKGRPRIAKFATLEMHSQGKVHAIARRLAGNVRIASAEFDPRGRPDPGRSVETDAQADAEAARADIRRLQRRGLV